MKTSLLRLAAAAVFALVAASGASAQDSAEGSDISFINIATCPVLKSAAIGPLNGGADVLTFNGNYSYFPRPINQADVSSTAAFRIHYYDTWKMVDQQISDQQYVLYQRGTTPPTLTAGQTLALPSNDYDNSASTLTIKAGVRYFAVPVQRVCVDETVSLSVIELLGQRGNITGYAGGATPTSPCAAASNFPVYDGTFGTRSARESFIQSNCDVAFGTNDAQPGNKTVAFALTNDVDLLARAEWIKFVGAFTNQEAAATSIFNGIKQRYNSYETSINSQFNGAVARPVVAWVTWNPYAKPAGAYVFSNAPYKRAIAAASGATFYCPAPSNGDPNAAQVAFASRTEFLSVLRTGKVSVFIDETYHADPDTYTITNVQSTFGFNVSTPQDLIDFPFLNNTAIYSYDNLMGARGSGGYPDMSYDWLEDALVNVDAVLADFAKTVTEVLPTPNAALAAHTRVWLREIVRGEKATFLPDASQCPAADIKLPSRPYQVSEATEASDPAYVTACPAALAAPQTVAQLNADCSPKYVLNGTTGPYTCPTVSTVESVSVRLVLGVDYSSYTANPSAFIATLKNELSTATAVSADKINIVSVTAGSVVVDAQISNAPASTIANIKTLIANPPSSFTLLSQVTSAADTTDASSSSSSSSTGPVQPVIDSAASRSADVATAGLIVAAMLLASKMAERM